MASERFDPAESAEAVPSASDVRSSESSGFDPSLSAEEQAFCRRFSFLALMLAVPVVVFAEFIVVRFVLNLVAVLRLHR